MILIDRDRTKVSILVNWEVSWNYGQAKGPCQLVSSDGC